MASLVTAPPQWRPAAVPGCAACGQRGDGLACNTDFRRWREHGRPAGGVPPAARCGQRPGVNALFWRWLDMDHRQSDASVADQLGVTRRTLNRWRKKQRKLIAEGLIDAPAPPPVSAGSALKASDSGYRGRP